MFLFTSFIPNSIFKLLKSLTPKIWLLILPSRCYIFPCKLVTRIWCFNRSRWHLLPDKSEYSCYLLSGLCREIMGRCYMLITSESERDLIHFVCLPKLRDSVLVNFKNGDFKIDNITFFLSFVQIWCLNDTNTKLRVLLYVEWLGNLQKISPFLPEDP